MERVHYLNNHNVSKKLSITGHEMVVFQSNISMEVMRDWISDQISYQRDVLIYDDQSRLKSTINFDKKDVISKPTTKLFSLKQSFNTMHNFGFQRIREALRNQIWKTIIRGGYGISFLFNFTDQIKKNMISVLNYERMLQELVRKSCGFPIDCCCIYPSSLEILDFTELASLHTNYQFFNIEPRTQIAKLQESEPLQNIARRSLTGNNSPFYFRKRNEIIGVAYDLETFYDLLGSIPLEVFCFHCYRMTNVDLAGKTATILPRSDIALWIELSIGDTDLAQKIYQVLQKSIGSDTSLARRSIFNKRTIRSSILQLIAERITLLKTTIS